jgi:hypothetical protein
LIGQGYVSREFDVSKGKAARLKKLSSIADKIAVATAYKKARRDGKAF